MIPTSWALVKIKYNNICETFSTVSTTNQIFHKILSSLEYCLIPPTFNNLSLLGGSKSCSFLLIKNVNAFFFATTDWLVLRKQRHPTPWFPFTMTKQTTLKTALNAMQQCDFQRIWHYLSGQVWNRRYGQQKESTYWLIKRISITLPLNKKKKSPSKS